MNVMVDKQCVGYVQKLLPGAQPKSKIKTKQTVHLHMALKAPLNFIYATHQSSCDLNQAFVNLFSLWFVRFPLMFWLCFLFFSQRHALSPLWECCSALPVASELLVQHVDLFLLLNNVMVGPKDSVP